MNHVAQPTVVVQSDVVHSGFIPQLPELGEISYIQLPVQLETDPNYQNYYIGINANNVDAFCYKMFQILCKFKLEDLALRGYVTPPRKEVGPPRLTSESQIFRDFMSHGLQMIRNNIPEQFKYYPWSLIYSTDRDGISLRTFYKNLEPCRASIIFFEDSQGFVFGGFASGVWELGVQYTGSGESFLFQLYPEAQLYPWFPQSNSYFMLSKSDHFEMGAGFVLFFLNLFILLFIHFYFFRPGIWIDQDFSEGFSRASSTFRSPSLSSSPDFVCTVFEAWSFDTSSNLTDYY